MGESFLEQSIFPDFLPLPSHCFCESSKSNKFLVCVWGGGGGRGGGWGVGGGLVLGVAGEKIWVMGWDRAGVRFSGG